MMYNMRNEEKFLAIILVTVIVGITISIIAADTTPQRIEACMTQPNMEYIFGRGCVRAV
jgi:hypothetical protein